VLGSGGAVGETETTSRWICGSCVEGSECSGVGVRLGIEVKLGYRTTFSPGDEQDTRKAALPRKEIMILRML